MKKIMTRKILSPAGLMEMVNAFRTSRIILTAFELEIFTILKTHPFSSAEIAEKLNLDRRATDRFLNAVVSLGLLEKNDDKFGNTSFTSRFLVKGEPEYLAGLAHQVHLWKTWNTLTEAIRKGTSVAVEEPIAERGREWLESFIAAMHSRGITQAKEVADLLDLSHSNYMLDVGGGSGAFAFEFIRRNPEMKGVIFDLPAVVPITLKYIEREGFGSKITTLEGDYLKDGFGERYDLILVSAVIHINSPEENELLIRKCAGALVPGGQIVILDHIMNDDRTEPMAGAVFALNMLVGTLHGDTYTENEIRSWMSGSGFKNITRKDSPKGSSIITGIR
jgi:3-hydroxy-5-methyl-1-naphthoate 3-O-methyltransferase